MRILLRLAVPLLLLVIVGIFGETASAHTLKIPRAANLNKANSKAFCAETVNDPHLGTCINWKAGPCKRLSEHRVRCIQEQTFEEPDGSQFLCGGEFEYFYKGVLSVIYSKLIKSATACVPVRGPTTPPPAGTAPPPSG